MISIVEFASQEDSQRAIRELSEQTLLGRPVFIREVSTSARNAIPLLIPLTRIGRMSRGLGPRLFQVKLVWLWLGKGCMRSRPRVLLHTISSEGTPIPATNSTLETYVLVVALSLRSDNLS
jgi:hypothetical protein